VVRDPRALAQLFDDGGVLVAARVGIEARGGAQIARLARTMWDRDVSYFAGSAHVLQARDTALVLGAPSVNVVRRGRDGSWRYAISLLQRQDNREADR
jgi:hypothetical protein